MDAMPSPSPIFTGRRSPDGTRIAFDSRKFGHGDIFVVNAQGGEPMRLTSDPFTQNQPTWSSDGIFIFFGSTQNGRWEIWKAPSTGGPSIQVTTSGAYNPRTIPGSPWIYYMTAGDQGAVWRMPESGGKPERVADGVSFGNWAPYRGGIARYNARTLDIKPASAAHWATLRKMPPGVSPRLLILPALSFAPDDRWALVSLTTLDRADLTTECTQPTTTP
jgi:hypothetical protein